MSNESEGEQLALQVRDDAGQPIIFHGETREACIEALRAKLCEVHRPSHGDGCYGLNRGDGTVFRISAAVKRKRGQGYVITHYTLMTWQPSSGFASIVPSWFDGWRGPYTYQEAVTAFLVAIGCDGPHWGTVPVTAV